MDQQKTDARIQGDEGTGPMKGNRLVVYDDATGKAIVPGSHVIGHPTIGIGRALDVNGLSMAEALFLMHDDETDVQAQLDANLGWWRQMDDVRQAVLISMVFNMGIGSRSLGTGVLGFTKTLSLMQMRNYEGAAAQLRASKWYGQVGGRGERLAKMMDTGVWA
jgi:lysozyme